MYETNVSNFLAAASNPNRLINTYIVVETSDGSITLTTNDIVSYKINYASTAGKYFTPGNFVAAPLEVSLNAASLATSNIDFKTLAVRSLSVYASIKASTYIDIPMGVFYVDDDGISVKSTGYITVKSSSMPPAMSETFNSSELLLPCTIQSALETLSGIIGIPIHASSEDFPNLSVQLLETFTLSATYKNVLKYIAETLGAYVTMGRDGEIYLKRVFGDTVDLGCTLDDNYLFSVTQQESTVNPFQYLSIKDNVADVGVTQEVSGVTTGKEYAIYGNPLTYGHPEDFLAGLVYPTSFTAFHPTKLTFHGRPDLDLGDVLRYKYKGVLYSLPVCTHTFEYKGGFKTTVESIGTDSLAVSSNNSISQAETDITILRQNINSLIRDLTQTQSEIVDINGEVVKVSSILQTVQKLQSQLSSLEGNVGQLSTLTQTANQLRLDIQTVVESLADTADKVNTNQAALLTYFDFQADGLTIGLNTSNIKLKLVNDKIQFLKEGIEMAYLTEGQLYVTDAHFIRSLVLGNFEFTPRTNGNLSLRRR